VSVAETPHIKWITPSPFEAVDGLNQILEIKTTNDKQLESVKWYHKDKPIEAATDRYGFPGMHTLQHVLPCLSLITDMFS